MSPRARKILFSGATFAALCTSCGTQVSGGGTQTFGKEFAMVGTLVDADGEPVAGAEVSTYRVFANGSVDSISDTTVRTNDTGTFLLMYDSTKSGQKYDLFGQYNDSELVVLIRGVVFDTTPGATTTEQTGEGERKVVHYYTDIGVDTMLAPGAIAGTVEIREADRSGILVYVPGWSFAARTDSTGSFHMSYVLPGTYEVRIVADGYLVARIAGIVVESGKTTPLPNTVLQPDPAGVPDVPTGLRATYDTLRGVALLSWSAANATDLAGYYLYVDTGGGSPIRVGALVSVTSSRDTLHWQGDDSLTQQRRYQVRAIDTASNLSAFSDPIVLLCPHPSRVRTTIRWSLLPGVTDTVAEGDTVLLAVACANPTRDNSTVRWFVGQPRPPQAVSTRAIAARSFTDTLRLVWDTSTQKQFHIEVTDQAGSVWRDSVTVDIQLKVLPIDTWEVLDGLSTPRRYLAAAMVSDAIYAVGGSMDNALLTGRPQALGTTEALEGNTWEATSSLNSPREQHCVVALAGKLYALGGYPETVDSVEMYDPASGRWIAVAAMPAPLSGSAACAFGDTIFVFGGMCAGRILDSIWAFHPATGQWETRGRMLTRRAFHQAVRLGDLCCILGGQGGASPDYGNSEVLATVETFSPATGAHAYAATMGTPRMYFGAAPVGVNVVVAGGIGCWKCGSPTILNSVEEWSGPGGVWVPKSSMPEGRFGFGSCTDGKALYVVGGAMHVSLGGLGQSGDALRYYP